MYSNIRNLFPFCMCMYITVIERLVKLKRSVNAITHLCYTILRQHGYKCDKHTTNSCAFIVYCVHCDIQRPMVLHFKVSAQ